MHDAGHVPSSKETRYECLAVNNVDTTEVQNSDAAQ